MAKSSFTLEWQAHEYEHKERSSDWYWAAGIITGALALVCIIFGNIILGILILLSAFSLALFVNRPPKNISVTLNETGITRSNVFYPIETIQSFWIDTEHSHKKILLRSKKTLIPLIIIPLGPDIDPERLRNLLSKYLREEYQRLPFVESIIEYLGF